MNFITFPVGGTNIFPIANSHSGGQLVTEYNLKSRESVAVGPTDADNYIRYTVGPSYVRSESDYYVKIQSDESGKPVSSTCIEISKGVGIINGHYVETLVPMVIDIAKANAEAISKNAEPLQGRLAIGIRAIYSTEITMAGSMLVENTDNMYEGLHVVILPVEQFKLPSDVPTQSDKVTAHIKLAEFNYINGSIVASSIVNNYPAKCSSISADRVSNIDHIISNEYVKKSGLNPKKLYTFSGKGKDPSTGYDTWCDSTDSLMVWDKTPTLTNNKPNVESAQFQINSTDGAIQLCMPHKQIDGMTTTNGDLVYYSPKVLKMPIANYISGSSGTVDATYTKHIKNVSDKITNIYQMTSGKQKGYIEVLNKLEDLPALNAKWSVGDYVLVGQDTLLGVDSDNARYPSSMYVVLPGKVIKIKYITNTVDSETIPLSGIEIDKAFGKEAPNIKDSVVYNQIWDFANNNYRGNVDKDYFVYIVDDGEKVTRYYYVVSESGDHVYSDAIQLTRQIPLAQEDTVGGFYNVPETAIDAGYVYRDDAGRLRLLDYDLLRSGTLAYQLGEDYAVPAGLTAVEVQNYLDEYVNMRIAFPSANQFTSSNNPSAINVTIDLSAEETEQVINLYGIDSRFNTSIYLHIVGSADSKTTINIFDCAKIRIDNNIEGTPKIKLYRSCLYYDASVIEYILQSNSSDTSFTGIDEMKLWYEKFESSDPNIVVNDMTVQELDSPILSEDLDFWSSITPNDNHYMYALHSITFSSSGGITGCSLLVKNETTSNVQTGDAIYVSSFVLPQGSGLQYPKSSITKQLKVTGTFVSAYYTDVGYMVTDTSFTALSQSNVSADANNLEGSIAFHTSSKIITNIIGVSSGTSVDGWEPNSYHIFYGGVIS